MTPTDSIIETKDLTAIKGGYLSDRLVAELVSDSRFFDALAGLINMLRRTFIQLTPNKILKRSFQPVRGYYESLIAAVNHYLI